MKRAYRFSVHVVVTAMSLGLLLLSGCHGRRHTTLTVSVAASLTDAITEIESNYTRDNPAIAFRNNLGSSGTLAQQIDDGAPVDIFLSAAAEPMNALAAKALIRADTRRDLLRNSLVLIAPRDSHLASFGGLANADIRLIALGDPGSVPAGRYGRETLTALKLFDRVQARLVLAKDVRQVLTYVETGNADAGLVYATDARTSGKVRIVATAPEQSHEPIVYPAAVVTATRDEDSARKFVSYLGSSPARAVFEKYGFTMAP